MSHRLIQGDVLDVLPTLGRFKLLIGDPPDNLGLGYEGYDDNMGATGYLELFYNWLWDFSRHADVVWVSFNAKWLLAVGAMVTHELDWSRVCSGFKDYEARIFIQSFTFGQNRNSDCGNGYRPLLRLKHRDAVLYPDAIRVPSWRQLNGDKRACGLGRVPLDHWADFPRITGNCKERRAWHPTQLREGMIERIIRFSTVPGDAICDAFSGTGTVLRAVDNLSEECMPNRKWPRNPVTSIELSPSYCARIAVEHGLTVEHFAKAA